MQGKWVECKKALPRVTFPNDVNNLMSGATLMRFNELENDKLRMQQQLEFEQQQLRMQREQKEREHQSKLARERLDLIAHHQERLRELLRGEGNAEPVLGERNMNTFQHTREIAIDDEGLTLPILIDEPLLSGVNKENAFRGSNAAGKENSKFRDQKDFYQMPAKAGLKDPRRRNFIQTTGKGRLNLRNERENRSFNVF